MIYLQLFWTFFKIGLFTIGGGYAMLPMIQNEVVGAKEWITQTQMLDFVGISEATPGPFAINLATFVGNQMGGVFGAVCATLGVVLPSLIIIIIVSIILKKFINSKYVQGFFYGVRPIVTGLIFASALTIGLHLLFPQLDLMDRIFDFSNFEWLSLILIALMFALSRIKYKGRKKQIKNIHPIILIVFSAVLGVILYGVFGL
jgi:chromate transporter